MKTKKKKIDRRKPFLIILFVSLIFFSLIVIIMNTDIKKPKPPQKITYEVNVTAYTSRPEETDETPYLTASGSHARDGVVASNFLPIGTLIKIPEYFGEKIFRVEDRMSKKYNNRIDVWFQDLNKAMEFGKKLTTIEVL